MELYYKEERDRDLFRAYNEALKSLGKMAVNVPREQIVRRVVYSIAPRFYISYEEARRNVKRIFKGYSPRCHRQEQRCTTIWPICWRAI